MNAQGCKACGARTPPPSPSTAPGLCHKCAHTGPYAEPPEPRHPVRLRCVVCRARGRPETPGLCRLCEHDRLRESLLALHEGETLRIEPRDGDGDGAGGCEERVRRALADATPANWPRYWQIEPGRRGAVVVTRVRR